VAFIGAVWLTTPPQKKRVKSPSKKCGILDWFSIGVENQHTSSALIAACLWH
jgi:hypothetical protein